MNLNVARLLVLNAAFASMLAYVAKRANPERLRASWILFGVACVLGLVLLSFAYKIVRLWLLTLGPWTFSFVTDPEDAASSAHEGEPRALIEELERLGFEPMGIVAEQGRFAQDLFPLLVSRERETFATVLLKAPPRLFFWTAFADGAHVKTNAYERDALDTGTFLRAGIASSDMALVLAKHAENVRTMRQRGHSVIPKLAHEQAIAAMIEFEASRDAYADWVESRNAIATRIQAFGYGTLLAFVVLALVIALVG